MFSLVNGSNIDTISPKFYETLPSLYVKFQRRNCFEFQKYTERNIQRSCQIHHYCAFDNLGKHSLLNQQKLKTERQSQL